MKQRTRARHTTRPTNPLDAVSIDFDDLDIPPDHAVAGWWHAVFDDATRVGLSRSIATGRSDRRR